tara:strand:+ start:303 stop:593 length:291 start_codon:yes stop_codon:yes gene_type:complete
MTTEIFKDGKPIKGSARFLYRGFEISITTTTPEPELAVFKTEDPSDTDCEKVRGKSAASAISMMLSGYADVDNIIKAKEAIDFYLMLDQLNNFEQA